MHAPAQPPIPSELLLLAYRSGIFPMADRRDDPNVFWVEPRERAVIPLDGFRLSQSLRKVVRRDVFTVTCDRAFEAVVEACADPRDDAEGTWISQRIESSYVALHHAGHAHSIECWLGQDLVGGLYGVSFDRVFCGESMFSRAGNASKVALAWLVALMRRGEFALLDCQFMTAHLASLGAVEMPQARYLELLGDARGRAALSLPEAYSAVLADAEGDGLGDAGEAGLGDEDARLSPGKLIAQSLTQTS